MGIFHLVMNEDQERIDDEIEADGDIRVWTRPNDMSVEEFMSLPPHELPPPEYETHNVVLNQFWSDLQNVMLQGSGTVSLAISILVLGTGVVSSVARTDTTLVTEWRRYPLISGLLVTTDPPTMIASFFIPAADGAQTITEVGLAYAGATTAPSSGKLATHAIFSYDKPNNQDVRLDYSIARSTTS